MPKLTIDNREVEVPEGATVLVAARKLGIDIPALCYRDGCDVSTSCLACVVQIGEERRMVPSCATIAMDGMRVESETPLVHDARRSALELLLSDHLGDCLAPCQSGCPAGMDIPAMLRQIAAGQWRQVIRTVKREIAMPAVFGRICPAPCEKVCHRGGVDRAVSICLLKRFVADRDLRATPSYAPTCHPASGRRVAILGGGPCGLSAAYYLAQFGHRCVVFEADVIAGGRLLRDTTEEQLPRKILAAEVESIARLGVELRMGIAINSRKEFERLPKEYDAVLVATGAGGINQASDWGLPVGSRGLQIVGRTYQTCLPRVFAAGNAIRGHGLAIRSAADGKEVAAVIDQFLRDMPVAGGPEPFSTRMGRLQECEAATFASGTSIADRREPSDLLMGYAAEEAVEQAERCLGCDCRGLQNCLLRRYAIQYNASPRRYKAERRVYARDTSHREVIYEPGKCIACGLCIQIASAAGEPIGMTFVGRGFEVRVAVPLSGSMAEALTKAAADCVAACPTAALAWKVRGDDAGR